MAVNDCGTVIVARISMRRGKVKTVSAKIVEKQFWTNHLALEAATNQGNQHRSFES
jgi:hypothetical protein